MQRATIVLLVFQIAGAIVALVRLSRWRGRTPPITPIVPARAQSPTTIVVATLNEAARISPLLHALRQQREPVQQILFVDGHSTDGTQALVESFARDDARVQLLTEPPLPDGWIGKAWALECGRRAATGEWILGLDADTVPEPALAASVVDTAEREGVDAVSFAPRFDGQSPLERWLQPSLLVTLIYRTSPSGRANRVLANGQCFLVRRRVLDQHRGYEPVRASFAEDVSLARHLAAHGARVAFRDGSRLFSVRSYSSAAHMWREWGRSIDLKDATSRSGQALDVAMLVAVQGMPVPLLVVAAVGALTGAFALGAATLVVNAVLVAVRVALGVALRNNYAVRGLSYWLSPLSDPLAALRIAVSSLRRPASWRGRRYT